MNIFISWSGEKSQAVGAALNTWIPLVLQSVKTWFSPEDIAKGARWFGEIEIGLEGSNAGIICLTAENKDSPWILFESGAIARGVGKQRLYTFLIDLKAEDVKPPLGQFNHTFSDQQNIFKLITDLNAIAPKKLSTEDLKKIFEAMWPQLQKDLGTAKKIPSKKLVPRESSEILTELLDVNRQLINRLDNIEQEVTTIRSTLPSPAPLSIFGTSSQPGSVTGNSNTVLDFLSRPLVGLHIPTSPTASEIRFKTTEPQPQTKKN